MTAKEKKKIYDDFYGLCVARYKKEFGVNGLSKRQKEELPFVIRRYIENEINWLYQGAEICTVVEEELEYYSEG